MGSQNEWDEDVPTVESNLGLYFREKEGRPSEREQVEGPGAPRTFPLNLVHMVIGRSSDAAIRVESIEVSRRHATVKRAGQEFMVEDLESRNGIYLNGVRIHSAALREGDTLQLGNVVFLYHEGSG
jgi:pSer/pThr/pTyr-binding forkhead associated (FHA) protein